MDALTTPPEWAKDSASWARYGWGSYNTENFKTLATIGGFPNYEILTDFAIKSDYDDAYDRYLYRFEGPEEILFFEIPYHLTEKFEDDLYHIVCKGGTDLKSFLRSKIWLL